MLDPVQARKQILKNSRRVVLKVGTRLLADQTAIARLVLQIHELRQSGRQVILVSSGAVGMGMRASGLKRRPRHLSEVQALAAMGQVKLMAMYEAECAKYGFKAAQLLLTADDLRSRERHLNAVNCIEALLAHDVLPIINENDPVSVSELKFGDNDTLAALLGSMIRADLTIILTTVDGLLDKNPDGTLGKRISVVRGVTAGLKEIASGTDDAAFSIGGMASKLNAAELLNSAGEALWIASGSDADVIARIFAAEDVGTVFLPPDGIHKMGSRKRWLASFSRPSGVVSVDDGAADALTKKGSSLLPSGVVSVTGNFRRGDVVKITRASDGAVLAKGITNFSSEEAGLIAHHKSADLTTLLGCDAEDELVHRNNMVLL
ncbi:MAG: glutamate 5-kinase [Lentisphaeria bacterium]|jgi:glutamate 5-kinase|nr:glutamate 5-kinase [Lentisphaeria bacterium]